MQNDITHNAEVGEFVKVSDERWDFHSPAEDALYAWRILNAKLEEFYHQHLELTIIGLTATIGPWPSGYEITAILTVKMRASANEA